jgi:hypothetical protein
MAAEKKARQKCRALRRHRHADELQVLQAGANMKKPPRRVT